MPPRFKTLLLLCHLFLLVLSDPVPEPDPEAEAEADPQYSYSYSYESSSGGDTGGSSGYSYRSSSSSGSSGMSSMSSSSSGMSSMSSSSSGGMYSMSEDSGASVSAETSSAGARPVVLPAPVPDQAGGGWSSGGSGGSWMEGGQSSGQCQSGMIDQCCNMADQGCCVNQGQQCYTVWEKQCQFSNKPQCLTTYKQKCDQVEIKSCRMNTEYRDIVVPINSCKVEREEKCFDYEEHQCKYDTKTHEEDISWEDEKLTNNPEPRQLCADVKVCKKVPKEEKRYKRIPEKKCEQVPKQRQQCRTVMVPQPPIKQQTVEYVTEYKQQCYDVPKPVCSQKPCTYAVQQENICPTCLSPGQPGPSCGSSTPCGGGSAPAPAPQPDMCGACRQQQVQYCTRLTQKCEMKNERVCQSVPVRRPVPGFKWVTPPPRPEMKCDTQTEYVQQCRVEYKTEEETFTVEVCETSIKQDCQPYDAPNYEVVRDQKNQTAVINNIKVCEIEKVMKKHCVKLPTSSTCSNDNIRRKVRITSQKCDRNNYKTVCKKFPDQNCQNSPGQVCKNVPRQVCQPTCEQNNYCNQCEQFAESGGFENCGTSTCPNFIARR